MGRHADGNTWQSQEYNDRSNSWSETEIASANAKLEERRCSMNPDHSISNRWNSSLIMRMRVGMSSEKDWRISFGYKGGGPLAHRRLTGWQRNELCTSRWWRQGASLHPRMV